MNKSLLIFGALLLCACGAANAHPLSCLLYTGGDGKKLVQSGDTLKATSNGVTITIYSMGGDSSFTTFQAVLNVPHLSDIRAYGTKDSLKALEGAVVGYLNHSRSDEISVTCEK